MDGEALRALVQSTAAQGPAAAVEWSAPSPALPLTDDTCDDLANATLVVTVHAGESGDAEAEPAVGAVSLPLWPLLRGAELREALPLAARGDEPPAWAATTTVEVHVPAVSALEEYALGGNVVRVEGAAVRQLPVAWLPADPDAPEGTPPGTAVDAEAAERLAALAGSVESNPVRYALEVELPLGTGRREAAVAAATGDAEEKKGDDAEDALESADEGKGAPTKKTHTLACGVLVYEPEDAAGGAEAKGDGEAEGKEAAAAAGGAGSAAESKGTEDDGDGQSAAADEPPRVWRIKWQAGIRAFLSKSALAELVRDIEGGEAFSLSLRRYFVAPLEDGDPDVGLAGARITGEDIKGRGAAAIHLDELLVPGATSTTGNSDGAPLAAVVVDVPPEALEAEQAARDAEFEAAKAAAEAEAAAQGGGGGKGGKAKAKPKGKDKKKDAKKGKGKGDAEPEPEPDAPHPLDESEAVLRVTVGTAEPLVLRPPTPPPPQLRPADILSLRPPAPQAPPGLAASAEFRRDVTQVAHELAAEFVEVCRETGALDGGGGKVDDADAAAKSREARRRLLLQRLNRGGKYHDFKERIKRSVVRIVRERFNRSGDEDGKTDAVAEEQFVSQLYTYLMGQVHRAVNRVFEKAELGVAEAGPHADVDLAELERAANFPGARDGDDAPGAFAPGKDGAPPIGLNGSEELPDERLKRLADEAEFAGDVERAQRFHLDRVAQMERAAASGTLGRYDAQPWHDFALFQLRRGDSARARACLTECVKIDDRRVSSLLALGVLYTAADSADRADVMLKQAIAVVAPEEEGKGEDDAPATDADPVPNDANSANDEALARTLLSIAQERAGDVDAAGKSILAATEALQRRGGGDKPAHAYLLAAEYLLPLRQLGLAEHALRLAAAALFDTRPPKADRVRLLLLEARAFVLQSDAARATERLDSIADLDRACQPAWELRGQLAEAAGRASEARDAYELAVGSWAEDAPAAEHTLLLRLGRLYLREVAAMSEGATAGVPAAARALAQSAKEVFLRAARAVGWALAWQGAGEAALRAGEREEAESALCEANVRDNYNAHVWGWLCLLCVTAVPLREAEAAQSLDQALRLGLADAALLGDVGAVYASLGKARVAEGVLRRACATGAAPATRRILGDAMAAQGNTEGALAEYSAVIAEADEAAERARAAQAAAAALAKLGRHDEADALLSEHAL